MSRTTSGNGNSKKGKSPVKRWFSFSGETGKFSSYNGSEVVEQDTLEGVLLDLRSCVGGWSDESNCKIWSNVIKSTKENIDVMVGTKKVLGGLFADIKPELEKIGAYYVQNLYLVTEVDGQPEICCLQVNRSSLASFSAFNEGKKLGELYSKKLVVSKGEQKKKGKVTYFVPKFELVDAEKSELDVADEKDHVLQAYFNPSQEQENEKEGAF